MNIKYHKWISTFTKSTAPKLRKALRAQYDVDSERLKLPSFRRIIRKQAPEVWDQLQEAIDAISQEFKGGSTVWQFTQGACKSLLYLQKPYACLQCSNLLHFGQICSPECQLSNAWTVKARTSRKTTCVAKYGAENVAQNKKLIAKGQSTRNARPDEAKALEKERLKATCLLKYGVTNPLAHEGVKAKVASTVAERYEGGHPARDSKVQAKKRKTNLKKFGVACAFQAESVKAKAVETHIRKTGYTNPQQDPAIHHKTMRSQYREKPWVSKDGTVLNLQGLEPFMATKLEQQGFKISIPKFCIRYVDPATGRPRVYHPDLIAKKAGEVYVVEVKSKYTLAADAEVVKAKAIAARKFCAQRGGVYVLSVLSGTGRHAVSLLNPKADQIDCLIPS